VAGDVFMVVSNWRKALVQGDLLQGSVRKAKVPRGSTCPKLHRVEEKGDESVRPQDKERWCGWVQ
jgi:hypothetical protein